MWAPLEWASSCLTVQLRVLQEEHREAKLTLRPPSLAAPYAPVQSWQHQPEKLIFESCGYEANVSRPCPPRWPASLLPASHRPLALPSAGPGPSSALSCSQKPRAGAEASG